MEDMTLLRLFILAVILVSTAQLCVITRYLLWPRIRRITHCAWCWQQAGIADEFPICWSSTICHYHSRKMIEQSRTRRLARQYVTTSTRIAVAEQSTEEARI
jgi:hypothetical protein